MNDWSARAGCHTDSDKNLDIENQEALLSYLRARGIISAGQNPRIRKLEGGVSNRTVLVHTSERAPFVVKQALPKLRVAVEWYSSPERIHREARGLEWLQTLAPAGSTVPLLFEDRERHIIGMSAVPEPHRNWKEALLNGALDLGHVEQFAIILGTIHGRSSQRGTLLAQVFGDQSFFETLRIEPYYRYSAQKVPETEPFLDRLIEETFQTRVAVVHGDYSPKNVLIQGDNLVLLDHEVIHFGDPAFDVGFSLTHLLSKALHLPCHRAAFCNAAHAYVKRYSECLGDVEWRQTAEPRAVRHTLACLLARVAGRSPLEYLTPDERRIQSETARAAMPHPPPSLSDLIDLFSEELSARC